MEKIKKKKEKRKKRNGNKERKEKIKEGKGKVLSKKSNGRHIFRRLIMPLNFSGFHQI